MSLRLLALVVILAANGFFAAAEVSLVSVRQSRLRELAEYPAQESKLIQAELDRIATALGPAPGPSQDGRYWRRWEAKA